MDEDHAIFGRMIGRDSTLGTIPRFVEDLDFPSVCADALDPSTVKHLFHPPHIIHKPSTIGRPTH